MGEEFHKNRVWGNLGFRDPTKYVFDWDTEDELDGLIYTDPGNHPELAAEFLGMLLEEDNPGHVAVADTKTLKPNTIIAVASTNSVIKNTEGVYNESDTPTSIFKTNPRTEAEPENEHEYSEDDNNYEDYDDDDDKVK